MLLECCSAAGFPFSKVVGLTIGRRGYEQLHVTQNNPGPFRGVYNYSQWSDCPLWYCSRRMNETLGLHVFHVGNKKVQAIKTSVGFCFVFI